MEILPGDEVYFVDRRGAVKSVAFFSMLAVGFLLFTIFLAPIVLEGLPPSAEAVAVVTGITGIVFSGIFIVISLRRLTSKEPYLVLSARGIHDNASGATGGAGWIDWDDIAEIRLSKYHNLPCVELVPDDRERFMQRFGWMERINRSARLGYPAVAFRGPLLPVDPSVLVEEMRTFRRRASGNDAS